MSHNAVLLSWTVCYLRTDGILHAGIDSLELHSLANMLKPERMALHQPGCLLQKVCASKAPSDLYNLAVSQVSSKERTKSIMVTKTAFPKLECQDFPNNAHKPILLIK